MFYTFLKQYFTRFLIDSCHKLRKHQIYLPTIGHLAIRVNFYAAVHMLITEDLATLTPSPGKQPDVPLVASDV